MADTTDVLALPYPEGADANDVPADMQALAERVDEVPGIESLTSAEIAALASAQKPAGRVVWNSTTSKLQVSNGSSFANIDAAALLLTGGTMSGAIAMGGAKITGLGAGTTSGDAVRYEQALLLTGGTMSGNINANGNKVTGLAAATIDGDAVRWEQIQPVYAIGTAGAGQGVDSSGETTLTFDAETDPSSMLNTGTGVITLATTGVWSIDAYAFIALAGSGSLRIKHGSTVIAQADFASGTRVNVSATISATASDTVSICYYNAATGSSRTVNAARLSVAKIGA